MEQKHLKIFHPFLKLPCEGLRLFHRVDDDSCAAAFRQGIFQQVRERILRGGMQGNLALLG